MTTITCDDCEATTIPCNCCEWCEMFPCECVDAETGEAYDADTLDQRLAEKVLAAATSNQ